MAEESSRPERLTDMKEVSKIAKAFMKGWDSGVLSTQFDDNSELFPLGTLSPFVLTEEGQITILISDLAVHTKNIIKNNKVGFTVFDMEASHKQASPRVSLTGIASLVDETESPEDFERISERYLTFFPVARNYFKAHNFYFYTIKPQFIHFIRTFGQIYSFKAEDHWTTQLPEWIGKHQSAIDHMNSDHGDALKRYAKNFLKIDSDNVELYAVDGEGYHLKVDGKLHYLNYLSPAFDKDGLHREFVKLAKL